MGTDPHISFSLEVDTETHTCTHNAHTSFLYSENKIQTASTALRGMPQGGDNYLSAYKQKSLENSVLKLEAASSRSNWSFP